MTALRLRSIAVAALLALGLSSCASGSIEDVQKEVGGKQAADKALNITAPPKANPNLTARVGMIVATNSQTWADLLSSKKDAGVAILWIQSGGPADGVGLAPGDVIVSVDAHPTKNAERAVVLLRARPDDRRALNVVKVDGTKKTVTVVAKKPPLTALSRSLYTPEITKNPNNPLSYFLRAQAGDGSFDDNFADVDKAVKLRPSFVEAISLKAELVWSRASRETDATTSEKLREQALEWWSLALGFDQANTRVLASLSQASSQRGNASSGRQYAVKAQSLDDTFPKAYYSVALANVFLGRYVQAAEPARKAVDLSPFDVSYYRMLAIVFMRLKRPNDARKTIDAILPLVPSDDTATREFLTQVLQDTGPSSTP